MNSVSVLCVNHFRNRSLKKNFLKENIQVEIWSDIMCPFCYIGKRYLEQAISTFEHKNRIEIIWKSFQLNPDLPMHITDKKTVYDYLVETKGITYQQSVEMNNRVVEMAQRVGLTYNLDRAIVANSFNAHRILQFAKTKKLGDVAEERLFFAYFTEGKDTSDPKVLEEIGRDIGLSSAEVQEALSDKTYADAVNQDIYEARQIGVSGVPFFVFDRKYAVSGAQPPEIFSQVLDKTFTELK